MDLLIVYAINGLVQYILCVNLYSSRQLVGISVIARQLLIMMIVFVTFLSIESPPTCVAVDSRTCLLTLKAKSTFSTIRNSKRTSLKIKPITGITSPTSTIARAPNKNQLITNITVAATNFFLVTHSRCQCVYFIFKYLEGCE